MVGGDAADGVSHLVQSRSLTAVPHRGSFSGADRFPAPRRTVLGARVVDGVALGSRL